MIKPDDRPRIRVKIGGRHSEISLPERQISSEEWDYTRAATYAAVRKDPFIPPPLIDLVERFDERRPVKLFLNKTPEGGALQIEIKVPPKKKTKRGLVRELAQMAAARPRPQKLTSNESITASEALAFFLRIILRDLKYAKKKREGAPSLTLKLVPRSIIAEITLDLLGSCETWNYAPGPHLNLLLRELLDLESYKHRVPRHVDAQEQAAFIIAQLPSVSNHELARAIKVNATTILRWRKSAEFQARVTLARESIEYLKSSGTWDQIIASRLPPDFDVSQRDTTEGSKR
jgi:hypothetical protein